MGIGFGQVLILLLIILILFGAGKLPKVMKDLAKGMKAFKEGLQEDDSSDLETLEQKPDAKTQKKSPVQRSRKKAS